MSELSGGDAPDSAVGGVLLDRVLSAAAGDLQAALDLPGSWEGEIVLDPTSKLGRSVPGTNWIAIKEVALLAAAVAGTPFWNLKQLLTANDRPTVIVVCGPSNEKIGGALRISANLALATLGDLSADLTMARQLVADLSSSTLAATTTRRFAAAQLRLPDQLLVPNQIIEDGAPEIPGLTVNLRTRAAGAAIAALATKRTFPSENDVSENGLAQLSFEGKPGLTLAVEGNGLNEGAQDAIDLYWWVTQDSHPDKSLAVQQVVAASNAADIYRPEGIVHLRDSAESVYRVLRSDAVTQATTTLRDTRKAAIDAARSSVDAALATAKSVAERSLAGLAAVGGLIVANATTKIPPSTTTQLAIAVAIYVAALGIWTLFVEGPGVTAPLRAFRQDLPIIADALTESQRKEILDLRALTLALWRARTIRIVAPLTYIAVSLALLGISVRSFSETLHLPLLIK
ncbi:MAG: hypothetical protein M3Y48_19865 [Actinomycetota bacterium]|nr:hypothetical protein [Actinomycetota bacterium]